MAHRLLAPEAMKAVIISTAREAPLSDLERMVEEQLSRLGYDDIHRFDVSGGRLAYCQGEFDCWLRTPGRCKVEDEQQAIVQAIPSADALVFLGPIAFGGFAWELKRVIDRMLCLMSPFFETRALLTHHRPRYAHYPAMYFVGLLPREDPEWRATFEQLNDANALNVMAPRRGAVALGPDRTRWLPGIAAMFANPLVPGETLVDRASLRKALLEFAGAEPGPVRKSSTAAVLVGSAKPKGTSVSESIARALVERLEAGGMKCEVHFATEFIADRPPTRERAKRIASADLFLLATPLYVDALPSLVTHALQQIASVPHHDRRLFVPVINCGFPEPEHTRTAVRIARNFARAAGYRFGGALPLGAGGVVQHAKLSAPHVPVVHLVAALDRAAASLLAGEPIPPEALVEIVEPAIPESFYRTIADLSFRFQAHKLGTKQRTIGSTPFTSR